MALLHSSHDIAIFINMVKFHSSRVWITTFIIYMASFCDNIHISWYVYLQNENICHQVQMRWSLEVDGHKYIILVRSTSLFGRPIICIWDAALSEQIVSAALYDQRDKSVHNNLCSLKLRQANVNSLANLDLCELGFEEHAWHTGKGKWGCHHT